MMFVTAAVAGMGICKKSREKPRRFLCKLDYVGLELLSVGRGLIWFVLAWCGW